VGGSAGSNGGAGTTGAAGAAGSAGAGGSGQGGSAGGAGASGSGGSADAAADAASDAKDAGGCGEASLTSDINCGSCGRDCTTGGATCSFGLCGTVQLFSDADMPFGADNSGARSWAFDPTSASAFWVGFNNYSVRRYPLDGSPASLVWQPVTAATAGSESIVVTGGNIYWSIGGTPPTVFQKAVGDAAAVNPTQAWHPDARASFLRVQGSSFYWVTGDYQDPTAPASGLVYTRLISAAPTDNGTAIVTVDQGNFADFKAFQPTSDALYWISDKGPGVAYELRTTPLAGGVPAAIPKVAGATDTALTAYGGVAPSLYASGATLYFNRNVGATSALNGIYKFTTGDTAPTQLVMADLVTNLIVDATSIYFLTQNSNEVFKAPIAGGAAVSITHSGGYKLIAQDSKYLYLLQAASGSSKLAKVLK
jgi:hypothetical protein